jgi:hypothetical protein
VIQSQAFIASRRLSHLGFKAVFFLGLAVAGTAVTACTQGAGEGDVKSDRLFLRDCWNAAFDLAPTFFAANPFSSDQLSIRVQRGDDNEEVSDGLIIMVNDVQSIRNDHLEEPLNVSLPAGVSPPGIPLTLNPNPPLVSLALYLHDTCHIQNGAVYSINGKITFHKLFSGNPNETNSDDRMTYADFASDFADPRDMSADHTYSPDVVSQVTGWFKFFFQRGQPAQPFP